MKIAHLTPDQPLASLKTSAAGLSTDEATRRRTEFGPNRLEEVARKNLLLACAREFTHFFTLILWLAALRDLLPRQVTVCCDQNLVELDAEALVPGDIVLIEEGDLVAADCRVIASFGLRVNIATATGESLPKARQAAVSEEDSPLFAKNIVLAGTSVVSGQGRAAVYATGMNTEFGRIAGCAAIRACPR